MVVESVDRGPLAAFPDRAAGLRLPALLIVAIALVQPLLHLPPVAPRRRLGAGPPDLGRDEGLDLPPLAGVAVVALRVEAGVGQGGGELHLAQGLVQQRDEALGIPRRPAAGAGPRDQVRLAVESRFQLGVAAVTDLLLAACAF